MRVSSDLRLVPALLTVCLTVVMGCKPPATGRMGGVGGGGTMGLTNAADPSFVLAMAPNGASSAPPDNIHVGTRLMYYTATASTAGDGHWYSPVGPGEPYDFEDKKTGQHYKDMGQKPSGGSSESYSEYNVIYMDDDTCVMEMNGWGLINGTTPKLFFRTAVYGLPGYGAGLWARPDTLAQLPDINTDDQKILRGPYKLGDKEVDSVWLSASSGTGNSYYVYDKATGLMIRYGGSASGTPGGLHAEGEVQTGGNFLAISTFLSTRQVTAPWFGDAPPAWVQSLNELDFEGQVTTQMQGSPALSLASNMKISITDRHPQWIKARIDYTVKALNSGIPDNTSTSEQAYASAMHDPLWIQPATLAKLQQGQQIDDDPTTKIQTQVVGTKQGPKGDMMVIAEVTPNGELDYGYDLQSGMLVYMRQEDKALFTTYELTLKNSS